MKLLSFLAAFVALTAATPTVHANSAADTDLIEKFYLVVDEGDVAGAKKLITAPNFRPTMSAGPNDSSVFGMALENEQPEIARLIMNSPHWKDIRWKMNKPELAARDEKQIMQLDRLQAQMMSPQG